MSKHQRTLHREAPSIDISSRRAAEETAWRIKSVKLQRDRHAQQRHLNPLNMADTFGHFIASFKGRHQDAILVIGEDTLEVFIEAAETSSERSGSKKVKKFLSKVVSGGRKHDDSSDDEAPPESASGVGDAEGELDGHLFSVGVAFAQILQLSQHGKGITIYYHPNSFSSTQSIRSNLASCWRFTVALDSPEEADGVMSDIRLQLARYAQGIHWVQKNFLLDESISAFLVTCGPPGPTDCPNPQQALSVLSPKSTHVILQMEPQFDTPFAAPDSWNVKSKAGEIREVIRVFLQTPTGCCHVDITRAVLQSHLRADRGQFYITATARPSNNEVSMEALERRRNEIDKYLVQKSNQSRLAHWTSNAGSTVSDSGFDEASTGAPTPRESSRQSLADPSGYQSDASVTEGRSPRSGRLRGGFAYSDRPILGQSPERSRSFSDQRHKLQLSNLGASPPSQAEETQQAMRRVASWSSATGSPKKHLSIDTTSHMMADATGQADMLSPADRQGSATAPRRMASVRFAEGQSGSFGAQASPRSTVLGSAATLQIRLHCRAQRVARQASPPPEPSLPQPSGQQPSSTQQLQSLDQLACQQPQSLADIVTDPAIWIGYTPLTIILVLVLRIMGLRLWNSICGSVLITAICVLYAAQQRLLLGRQELMAVRRTKQAVVAASSQGQEQQQQQQAVAEVPEQPKTQIMLTLLGAEIADNFSADDAVDMYDDDDASEMSLEMGAEAGPAFEARAQAQSLAGVGPSVGPGIVGEPQKQNSGLRRFSKDHAVSDDVQKRFMIAVENDEKAAKKRVQDMLEWKKKHHLDTCLQTPKPHFDTMKEAILHGIVCFSKTDHLIRIIKVGDMRKGWKKMKAAGINSDEGLRHFGLMEEYNWQILDNRAHPLGTAIWIVDLGGMGLSDLGSEAFQFFKRMSVEVGFHYPERLHKLVLLNSPSFFSLLWKICEPIMPGNTRNKVKVVRSHQELITALADECDQSDLPSDYGGTSPNSLYQSKIETEMREFVHNLG